MYTYAFILLAGSLFPVAGTDALPDECRFDIRPGTATGNAFPGYHDYVRVYLPESPPGPRGYPVILWYHGQGAALRPNTQLIHAVTGGEAFLLVGMNYGSRRFYEELDRRALAREQARIDDLLSELEACVSIDRDSLLLAGYSQGGYAVTLLGERMLDRIAGLVVLGAGRADRTGNLPERRAITGLPMFFAAGADDEAYGAAAEASARLYAGLGAQVSLERWPETDHFEGWQWYQEDEARTVGLRNWLNDALDRVDARRDKESITAE